MSLTAGGPCLKPCLLYEKSIKKCERESARRWTDTWTEANWVYNLSCG